MGGDTATIAIAVKATEAEVSRFLHAEREARLAIGHAETQTYVGRRECRAKFFIHRRKDSA
tara:strand:+ start:15805 stop:15987 length:183 start_codon:yes stop_codon:yes gene_type:complete